MTLKKVIMIAGLTLLTSQLMAQFADTDVGAQDNVKEIYAQPVKAFDENLTSKQLSYNVKENNLSVADVPFATVTMPIDSLQALAAFKTNNDELLRRASINFPVHASPDFIREASIAGFKQVTFYDAEKEKVLASYQPLSVTKGVLAYADRNGNIRTEMIPAEQLGDRVERFFDFSRAPSQYISNNTGSSSVANANFESTQGSKVVEGY